MNTEMEWWGYSTLHGWVVLDRSVACNVPGIRVPLEFVRARDMSVYTEPREKWVPPHYRFAPNYLGGLKGDEAVAAAAELEAFKALWPETQGKLEAERKAAHDRAEALRIEAEQSQKAKARSKKSATAEEITSL